MHSVYDTPELINTHCVPSDYATVPRQQNAKIARLQSHKVQPLDCFIFTHLRFPAAGNGTKLLPLIFDTAIPK